MRDRRNRTLDHRMQETNTLARSKAVDNSHFVITTASGLSKCPELHGPSRLSSLVLTKASTQEREHTGYGTVQLEPRSSGTIDVHHTLLVPRHTSRQHRRRTLEMHDRPVWTFESVGHRILDDDDHQPSQSLATHQPTPANRGRLVFRSRTKVCAGLQRAADHCPYRAVTARARILV